MENTKIKIILVGLLFSHLMFAQNDSIESRVYSWQGHSQNEVVSSGKTLMFEGCATDLEYLRLYSVVVEPGESFSNEGLNSIDEKLFILKSGELEFKIKNDKKLLGPSSVAIVLPDESYNINNETHFDASYYLFEYKSKDSVDIKRGRQEGGSFLVNWNDITFHPHDKGGIREYFERATAMLNRIEMHVTTLKPAISSHEPHTHTSDEMVLMIAGNATLQVGESFFDAAEGDLIFLGANKPHALSNNSDNNCMYFAFHVE